MGVLTHISCRLVLIVSAVLCLWAPSAGAFYLGAGLNLQANAGLMGGFGGLGGYGITPQWQPPYYPQQWQTSYYMQPYLRPMLSYQWDYMLQPFMYPTGQAGWPGMQGWPQQTGYGGWPQYGMGLGWPFMQQQAWNQFPAIPQWTPRIRAYSTYSGGSSGGGSPPSGGGLVPGRDPAPPSPPPQPEEEKPKSEEAGGPPAVRTPILDCLPGRYSASMARLHKNERPTRRPADAPPFENATKPCCELPSKIDPKNTTGKPHYEFPDKTVLDNFVCTESGGTYKVYMTDSSGARGIQCNRDGTLKGTTIGQLPSREAENDIPCTSLEVDGFIRWPRSFSTVVCSTPQERVDRDDYPAKYNQLRRLRIQEDSNFDWNVQPRCENGRVVSVDTGGAPPAATARAAPRAAGRGIGPDAQAQAEGQGSEAQACVDGSCEKQLSQREQALRDARIAAEAAKPNPIKQGVRAVLSNISGSCFAGDVTASAGPQVCQRPREIWGYDAKAPLELKEGVLKLSKDKDNIVNINAYTLYNASLVLGGLKFSKSDETTSAMMSGLPLNLESFLEKTKKADSCLQTVTPTNEKPLQDGDIIISEKDKNMSIIIDNVVDLKDPFGVGQTQNCEPKQTNDKFACNERINLNNAKFDISYTQTDTSFGRGKLSAYLSLLETNNRRSELATAKSVFCEMALNSCKARRRAGQAVRRNEVIKATGYHQIRHLGAETIKPLNEQNSRNFDDCRFKGDHPALERSVCLNDCFKRNSNQTRTAP